MHNPRRWSRQTHDWTPIVAVTLNPEKDAVVQAALDQTKLSGSAGAPAFPSRHARDQPEDRSNGHPPNPDRGTDSWERRENRAATILTLTAS
jgi:hypothetical protein